MVPDHGTISSHDAILAFDLSVFRDGELDPTLGYFSMDNTAISKNMIRELSRIIRTIKDVNPEPTAHVYTWSAQEFRAINDLIVYEALSATDVSEDIRQCIGTMVDLPSLLQTPVQPSLFGDSKNPSFRRQREDPQLETSFAQLRIRTADQPKLRKLPSIVALHPAAREVIGLPGPGYTTLEMWARHLAIQDSVPSEHELYISACEQRPNLKQLLASQSKLVQEILCALRHRVGSNSRRVFINLALPLRPQYKPVCHHERLRKLVFMHEVFLALSLFSDICSTKRFFR